MSISVELFGGPKDGTLLALPDGPMPNVLRMPVAPTLAETLGLYRRPSEALTWLAGLDLPEPLQYEWDGTVREDGVYRFRLR